jgi:hypothetical protein
MELTRPKGGWDNPMHKRSNWQLIKRRVGPTSLPKWFLTRDGYRVHDFDQLSNQGYEALT